MTQEHNQHNHSADPLHAKKEAWSGRFSEPVAEFVLRYTQSVSFDKRMAMADIAGVPTPTCHAVITMARAILGDKLDEGRTAKNLGIEGMTKEQFEKLCRG